MSRDLVEEIVQRAMKLGAQEVKAGLGRSVQAELSQREGKIEQTSEATTQGLGLSLLVDDRFSTHSTSDLRPEALETFLKQAIAQTRYLEQDPDRRMLSLEEMGSADLEALDLFDPRHQEVGPELRRDRIAELEGAMLERDPGDLVSTTAHLWTSSSQSWLAFSNGFVTESRSTSFGMGAELTIREESGKLPEAACFYGASHREDVPAAADIAQEAWNRVDRVREAKPVASGRYPMLLSRRVAGRILGMLIAPLSGGALWQKRSCLADKLGESIASSSLTLLDEPLLVRAAGSRPFDGDGRIARPRVIVQDGRLETFFISVYHGRKLDRASTTDGVSNVVIPPGDRSPEAIARELPQAILVDSFLGGNSDATSGEFSFGIRGRLLEHGEVTQNIAEMNLSGNLLSLLPRFREAADDVWVWSRYRVPTLLFEDVQFSGQ